MLKVEEKPLEPARSQRISQWLLKPELNELLDHLSACDARLSAEAANLLTDLNNPNRLEEAKARAEEANAVRDMIDRLSVMRDPDYKFHRWTITPMPNSTTNPT